MKKIELLAPAGDKEKFYTALHFGADAVYMAGKKFGLRAYAGNFDLDDIKECCGYAHNLGKNVYVTVNIYAYDEDFDGMEEYLIGLQNAGVDAILVSDPGIFALARRCAPKLPIHVSTQANTTNARAAKFWAEQGASRVVVARECSLNQIKRMKQLNPDLELEAFVHGAMCISYSGRCLLSNFLSNRPSNHGECVQACRWCYSAEVLPEGREETLPVTQDERGTYIFNSRDLNMLEHLDDMVDCGLSSLKIEGRMKSPYYVATVVNAYRRALDKLYEGNSQFADQLLVDELTKASHRAYTTGFFYEDDSPKQYYQSSRAVGSGKFVAVVNSWQDGVATIEMRNRFAVGDQLQILSSGDSFSKSFEVTSITDANGDSLNECIRVQQIVRIPCSYKLEKYDILRTDSDFSHIE